MAVPSRLDAAALLLRLDPPEWFMAHSTAVAEVAAFLAHRLRRRGYDIDIALVEAAALLHDVDKVLPADAAERYAGAHGEAGAAWLAAQGHPELGPAVANHPVTRLSDDSHHGDWVAAATREERIVAYADKRAAQDLVSLDERFSQWRERHPEHAAALDVARARAGLLEMEICAAADIAPHEVERLPWVDAALRAARESP